MYAENDVLRYAAEEDVKFIRLAFSDIFGNQKNLSIMPSELNRAFSEGIQIDSSAIPSFGTAEKSELYLFPDCSTLSVLPWRPSHGKVVRLFCDICYPDASPYEMDTRLFLKNAVKAAANKGIELLFSPEMEFYLFKTDENGDRTDIPYDNAGYLDVAPYDKGENIRREICLTLEDMGFTPETSHHEEGPGQNEIDFRYSAPLLAADHAITFQNVVKTVAYRNGAYACFSPKPISGSPGNGMHINISLPGETEDKMMMFMAGIMSHIREITLFLNPINESYKRIGCMKAPKYITWAYGNRSQLIRIPHSTETRRRIELRSPDPLANPYIAFGLLIYAGLDGIENKMQPPEPDSRNLFDLDKSSDYENKLDTIPLSLHEASLEASSSKFVASLLAPQIIREYSSL